MYQCLDTTEKAAFQVAMMSNSLQATPFTGQRFLDTLPESEVECLQTNLPKAVFTMIENAPSVAGGELRDAPPQLMACISAESLARIPGEIVVLGMGAPPAMSHAPVCSTSFRNTAITSSWCVPSRSTPRTCPMTISWR